jgi:molecular chaperone GrpE
MAATTENDSTPAAGGLPETNKLQDELRREREMHLRALADFDNYRKRVERERADAAQSGRRDIVLKLLDLADSFDRAFAHAGEAAASWVEGLQSIRRKLLGLLESQGVTPFESLGEPFNPERHEAIGTVDSNDYEPGSVAEELQRGYRWGDSLLRPARVRVAR